MLNNEKGAQGACDTEDAQAIRRSESLPPRSLSPAQQLQQIFASTCTLGGTERPWAAPWEISRLVELDLQEGRWLLRTRHPYLEEEEEVEISVRTVWHLLADWYLDREVEKVDPQSDDRIRWARRCERRAAKLAAESIAQTLVEREVCS